MDLSKLLIIGKNSSIAKELNFGIKLSKDELNVINSKDIEHKIKKYSPSGILYLASIDLKNSKEKPLEALEVNVIGLYNVAKISQSLKIPIIIVSSGAIFSGKLDQDFNEYSKPEPINFYGQTKYFGEIILQNINKNFLIIRTGWLFGFRHKKNGFTNFIDILFNNSDKKIYATKNLFGSPTYIKDFIVEMKNLISLNKKGIFHVVNSGRASAKDIALESFKITGKSKDIEFIKFKNRLGEPKRSETEVLKSTKLKLKSWQEALKDYFKDSKQLKAN